MKKQSNINALFDWFSISSWIIFNALLGKKVYISITNKTGKITYVNNNFVKVSKYSKNELVGQNHRILKSGHHSSEEFDILWATISGGNVWRGILKNKAKDGSYFWVDTIIKPITARSRYPSNYVAIRYLTKNQE